MTKMETRFFKLTITKHDELWICGFYNFRKSGGVDKWCLVDTVSSISYTDLQFKMAEKGFIDILNKNK